jgi:hypothetical protein
MVRLRSVSLLLVCLFVSAPAFAASHIWTGVSDDHFSNAANWIGGSPAGDAAAALSFPATGRPAATNDLNRLTVQSIAFSGNGFTIGGNTVTLAANATVIDASAGTNTITCDLVLAGNVAVSVTGSIYDRNGLALSGAVSGSGGITLRGGGHLIYTGSAPNTYTGSTVVLYGELQLKKAANVTAIAGDLDIETDGFNYEYGYVSVFNDEQIANSSHVTVGYLAELGCGARETLGPVTLTRYSSVQTTTQWSGNIQLTGTVIFAGDIEIVGTAESGIKLVGRFLLQGLRTINAVASYGALDVSGLGQQTAGSGIVINVVASTDGRPTDVLNVRAATYDGPTTINGGSVSIDAPASAVNVKQGRYTGHCKSLTADSGQLSLKVAGVKKPVSPFTFGPGLTTTLRGVTPGAMTFWLANARTGNSLYEFGHVVNDDDHDGSVAVTFPFKVTTLPPFGVWLVADLSAHTIVADNPGGSAPVASDFPANPFLRDIDGNYTHVQFPAGGSTPHLFAWTRPGVGAWMTLLGDGSSIDEDGGSNGRITFETTSMTRSVGTTAAPPADGMRPGDMFLAIDGFGSAWWGDSVDLHLSSGSGKVGFPTPAMNAIENAGDAKVLVERTEGSEDTVTVQYATEDGTAVAGRDYTAQAGALTFGRGEILKTIDIPVLDDHAYGGDRTFDVKLSNPAGAQLDVTTHTVRTNTRRCCR